MKAIIQTYSGAFLDVLNPDPALITLEDIAHALSLRNRFTGHTRVAYSVAEHCFLGSYAPREGLPTGGRAASDRELAFLLHELDEVFLPDIAGPLKPYVSLNGEPWAAISRKHKRACRKALGLEPGVAEEGDDTREIDARMLATERRDLMHPNDGPEWAWLPEPYHWRIEPWSAAEAERMWLVRYRELRAAVEAPR